MTFVSNRDGPANLFHQAADFSATPTRLVPAPAEQVPWDWSPDGRHLLFADYRDVVEAVRDPGLWVYDRETDQVKRPTDGEIGVEHPRRTSASFIRGAQFHPSGSWIAYAAYSDPNVATSFYNPQVPFGIWVRPFPGPGTPRLVHEDGHGPRWSHDGNELFFRGKTHLWAAPVAERDRRLVIGEAAPLFEDRYLRSTLYALFDVHSDGRFLMVRPSATEPSARIVVVQNLRTKLEELFPEAD